MSIKFTFNDDKFSLNKLCLPSRHYYFNDSENYIKLLNIGEGIFPKDKIKTNFSLNNSNLIITTESATKIYPSKKEYGINSININLKNSNLEFINDELILYKDSKLVQVFRLNFDKSSTFFYGDILSKGRSYEEFDFSSMLIKNSFYSDKKLEYMEKFHISGENLKDYTTRKKAKNKLFAKIYIKAQDNNSFLDILHKKGFESFTFSKDKEIIIASISHNDMNNLKALVENIWTLYRQNLNKKVFVLGKQ